MAAWRNLGILIAALFTVGPAWAQTYNLTETNVPGDCYHLKLAMKLAGDRHIVQEDKPVPVHLSASAVHELTERILAVGSDGLAQKNLRFYHEAQVHITTAGSASERTVRTDRRLIVAQRCKDQFINYCPEGALTREELQTLEHFDTFAIPGLLPGKAMAIGQTWKVPNAAVQCLCSFEGLIDQDLTGKLEGVTGDEARIAITGTANGIFLGAMAKLSVTATATFDVKAGRLTALTWHQKDVRDQGPASPATTLESTWTINRVYLDEQPKEVSDVALVKVPEGMDMPPAPVLQLCYHDLQNGFQLHYDREWYIVGQQDKHLILRLMDRGDWVAQATITVWDKTEAGKHLSPDEFKDALADIPGWEPDEIREDSEVHGEIDHYVYRVSALGEFDELKVLKNFYLVAGSHGNQVVVDVTLKPALAEKLGTRDLKLVDGIDLSKH